MKIVLSFADLQRIIVALGHGELDEERQRLLDSLIEMQNQDGFFLLEDIPYPINIQSEQREGYV